MVVSPIVLAHYNQPSAAPLFYGRCTVLTTDRPVLRRVATPQPIEMIAYCTGFVKYFEHTHLGFLFVRTYTKCTLACGSMVLFFFVGCFFALQGEKTTDKGYECTGCVSPICMFFLTQRGEKEHTENVKVP